MISYTAYTFTYKVSLLGIKFVDSFDILTCMLKIVTAISVYVCKFLCMSNTFLVAYHDCDWYSLLLVL